MTLHLEIKARVKLTNAENPSKDGGYLDLVQKDGKLKVRLESLRNYWL
jgi:hypothetical protein